MVMFQETETSTCTNPVPRFVATEFVVMVQFGGDEHRRDHHFGEGETALITFGSIRTRFHMSN